MLESPEPNLELEDWLRTLHLSQYALYFQQGGYHVLEHCKDLTDERLLELKVLPTGHRRRILRSLEALGVKQQSWGEEDEEGGQRKPVLHPRHIFLKDKKRGTSCQHPQSKETREHDLEGSQTLPPGAGLGSELEDVPESTFVRPPLPAPRNPQNIQKCTSQHPAIPPSMSSISSSSSESIAISETPSDWEVSSEEPSLSSIDSASFPALSEDHGGFQCEMVENSLYDTQMNLNVVKGQRFTRSYRLRHRPVPEIPIQTIPPLQERSVLPAQTTSPKHLTGSQGPTGANGIQKDLADPICPIGQDAT